MIPLKHLLIFAALVIAPAWLACADTLWIGDGAVSKAIKADNVKVVSVKEGKVYYTNQPGGQQVSQPFAKLAQINIEGETVFNTAENAFGSNDTDGAITNYLLVLQSASSKDWMQSRAATRLMTAAKTRDRYDAEVTAYCSLLLKEPATAAVNKPGTPPEHSPYLDAALGTVQKVIGQPSITVTQKSTLLNLELEIDRAKGDKAQTSATLQQLVALGGPVDQAMVKIAEANVDLDAKQYDKAIAAIDKNRAIFNDPDQQVDALYILALAHMGLEGDKADSDKLKDLALNFMRVVTFGNKLADRPHVADSLLQVAQIEEKLGEKQAAITLDNQIVKEFVGTPAAAKAQMALGQASREGPSK